MQYDFGKSGQGKEFIRTGDKLNESPEYRLEEVIMLQDQHERKDYKISKQLSKTMAGNPLRGYKVPVSGFGPRTGFSSRESYMSMGRSRVKVKLAVDPLMLIL